MLTISRESTESALRAYSQERDPQRKAAIFARDLRARIKAGEDIPILASNTLGTVAGELIVQQALELLTLNQPLLAAITQDFSDQPCLFNKEINTRIVSALGTTAYSTSTGYATENTTTTDVPVTIDQHKSCQVSFNVEELAGTNRQLFDEHAPAMSYAIGKDLADIVLALITTTNYTETPTTQPLLNFDRSTVVEIAGALSDRGVPLNNRTLLLTSSYYDKLFSDNALVTLAGFQRPDLITGSKLLPVADFNVMRTPTLPTTGNLTGFGFSKSALVLASRVPGDYRAVLPGVTGGGVSQVITNPETGLSVMLTQFINDQLGSAFVRMAYMFGAAKGQIKCGQIVRSGA